MCILSETCWRDDSEDLMNSRCESFAKYWQTLTESFNNSNIRGTIRFYIYIYAEDCEYSYSRIRDVIKIVLVLWNFNRGFFLIVVVRV